MNKAELIASLTGKSEGISKKDVTTIVEGFLNEVTEQLANGEKVQLVGFGSFENHRRAERQGVNPKLLADLKKQGVDAVTAKAQAAITIESSSVPKFKAGAKLKEAAKQ